MSEQIKLSRRDALKAAGGSVVAGGLLGGSASASTGGGEYQSFVDRIGTLYQVADGSSYTLEEVLPMGDALRVPGRLLPRQPLALVFKHINGEPMDDGVHMFQAALMRAEPLLVSGFEGADGDHRLEAILN